MSTRLRIYDRLSRLTRLNYRAKIMLTAFVGTHVPLLALVGFFAVRASTDWAGVLTTLGITLAATLIGTGITLLVLNGLLRPVIMTSEALRAYRENRQRSDLPLQYTDEAGTLMADAALTIDHLEAIRDTLEHTDETTGLANRRRALEIIGSRLAEGRRFYVGVVRFANYDRVVEALDLHQADIAMRTLAERLAPGLPEGASLARTGPGDFALLSATELADGKRTADALSRLIADAGNEIDLPGLRLQPQLTCGIAAAPTDADDATELLDHAISAAAGATFAAPIVFHSTGARTAALDRLKLEQELRRALDHNEFTLHYQPVIDLSAGTARSAEALIRWNHPERGLLPPAAFLPAAEATGLIEPIGLWVLREATSQVRAWNTEGRHDLKVAINLSARQLLDPELRAHVADATTAAGIDPRQLEIELTETAAMADHDHTRRVFGKLRDLGVTIAIDDFGTGYASMSWLRNLPFDKLKLDREFVTEVHARADAQAICRAVVALAGGLNLELLAEGAETEDEVRFLSGLGCNLFQGYYFSRPVPPQEVGLVIDALKLRTTAGAMRAQDRPTPKAAGFA